MLSTQCHYKSLNIGANFQCLQRNFDGKFCNTERKNLQHSKKKEFATLKEKITLCKLRIVTKH